MIERNDHVRVTSMTETITGRFDGEDYQFLPNTPVDIHLDVAAHIFGFGKPDKSQALARLGWATSSDAIPKAMERLSKIRFTKSPPLIDAPETPLEQAVSASERVPNQTSGSRPLAQGGDTGAPAPSGAPAEPPKARAR